MIIIPLFLRERSDTENDADWVNRMMPSETQRGFPVNAGQSCHGSIHLTMTKKKVTINGERKLYHA